MYYGVVIYVHQQHLVDVGISWKTIEGYLVPSLVITQNRNKNVWQCIGWVLIELFVSSLTAIDSNIKNRKKYNVKHICASFRLKILKLFGEII